MVRKRERNPLFVEMGNKVIRPEDSSSSPIDDALWSNQEGTAMSDYRHGRAAT